uniref:Kallikrein toxin Var14 n=1 Tax=Varanus komodoensis TaxID=61221 RepID=B6CJU6_VARKO|nr:kallikrein toxin Var14 [Varanus komodoensis]
MGPAKLVAFVLLLQPSLVLANPVRVVGGQECEKDGHRWLGLLQTEEGPYCGVALISQNWVLSAAHCYESMKLQVRLGVHHRGKPIADEQLRDVDSTFCYPDAPDTTNSTCPYLGFDAISNDIMLMKLSSPVTYNEHIASIALPDHDAPMGTECTIMGWGLTGATNGSYPKVPLCASVNTFHNSVCDVVYPWWDLTDNQLCAGVLLGGIDTCKGDSGGPLVCGGRIQGVVSFGDDPCGQLLKPGVYTNVYKYVHWIHRYI